MADLVAGAEGKQIHVAMLAMPIPGHIIPMLHLSFQLASKGVKVTFVNSEHNRSKMKLPACMDTTDSENEKVFNTITFLYIPDGLPPGHGEPGIALAMALDAGFGYHFEELLHNQLALQQDPPITCIVANTFIRHVQETARTLGLPYVSFWTQSAASFVSVGMVAKGYRPPEDSQPSDFLTPGMLPGVPTLKLGELNGFLKCYNEEDFMFRFFVAPHERIAEVDCILLNTFEELEEETMAALRKENPNALAVGPLLPGWFLDVVEAEGGRGAAMASWDVADEDGQGCLRWLDKQEERSVIYVCFGSMTVMCREQIQEIAMGLEASKQAFLWVVRPALGRSKEEELPAGFLDRTAAQGLVISWAPQLSVLRHKAVAGFLTHCGWNSTLEGICAGVPLLAWPSSFSDQATNRRCIVDEWRMGLSLERAAASPPGTGLVERGEVEKKVVELMWKGAQGKALRGMANQWRVKAASSSSSLNLQRFLDIVSKSQESILSNGLHK